MTYATPETIIAVSVIFPVLSIIAVALRFHTRRLQKTGFQIDDWLILPALVKPALYDSLNLAKQCLVV